MHQILFRSSPEIELKQLADLEEHQREPFRELESDPEFYGLFVAKPPRAMNLKSVDRQTARLFQSLATPSRLDEAEDVIDLVLDGIFEIEGPDGFVFGADALPIVCAPSDIEIARLSRDALLYAQDLETNDPQTLTTALYFYHRIPLSPFWKSRFASREAILAHLGADRGALRTLLERNWTFNDRGNYWMSWSAKMPMVRGADDVTYKLYVSPRPEHIREAFEILVRVLSEFPSTPFKIGDSAAALLRPDKLVAYFQTREQLTEAYQRLRDELAGCEAHGIPFTAAFDDSGLLSWGVDPPDNDRALRWLGRDSWRLWVAKRLGSALSIAKSARSAAAAEPWRFAIERARRHGIDVETWTPSATLWSTR